MYGFGRCIWSCSMRKTSTGLASHAEHGNVWVHTYLKAALEHSNRSCLPVFRVAPRIIFYILQHHEHVHEINDTLGIILLFGPSMAPIRPIARHITELPEQKILAGSYTRYCKTSACRAARTTLRLVEAERED